MAVIDAQGRLVFSNLAKVEAPVDLSDREHFRVHRDHPQQDRLYISKPVLGRVSKQWTIQFTRPIHKDGQFAGCWCSRCRRASLATTTSRSTSVPTA